MMKTVVIYILLMGFVGSSEIVSVTPLSRNPNLEPIPLWHDDQGFAPLRVPQDTYKDYFHDIPKYIQRLPQIFAYEMGGHNTSLGVHMPPWIVWSYPFMSIKGSIMRVYLSSKSLDNPIKIGSINLKKKKVSSLEGYQRIKKFLLKYVDFDQICLSHPSSIRPPKGIQFNEYWTEVDDYILRNLMISNDYALRQTYQGEVVRLIGEFFRWRGHVADFCQDLYSQKFDPNTVSEKFKVFLEKKQKLPEKEATKYSHFMSMNHFMIGVTLHKLSADDDELMDRFFSRFIEYKLIASAELASEYQEDLFPKKEEEFVPPGPMKKQI